MKDNEWISVKERLPEIGKSNAKEFLVACGKARYVFDYITDENGDGRFYMSISWPTRVFSDCTQWVTAWQTLPSPP
jgi:hypothetical protein